MDADTAAFAPSAAPVEAPRGALLTWGESDTGLDDFRAWHNREHLPERIAIPGIDRSRRFRSLTSPCAFLSIYDLASIAVLDGAAYRAVMAAPSAWTRRILAMPAQGARRAVGTVRFSAGEASGGLVGVWRFDALPADAGERIETLRREVLPAFATHSAFAALTLVETDAAASGIGGAALATLRAIAVPRLVVVAEGWTDATTLRAASASLSACLPFDDAPEPELYTLEVMFSRQGSLA